MSIIPISAIIIVFILFLTYYWFNISTTIKTIEIQNVEISSFNSYYFSKQKYGKIPRSNEFKYSNQNFTFPVYTGSINGVKLSGRNI